MLGCEMQSSAMGSEQRNCQRVHGRVGNYLVGKTIGHGNFAVVRVAKHGIASKKVALKVVDKSRLLAEDMSEIEREINILKNLDHPHIVKLYETTNGPQTFQIINTDQFLYVVMEYASNGELFELIIEKGCVTENEARRLFQQISAAVAYCHARGVVHRDLKAENLLLDANNDIKIIDFGFSNIQKPQSLLTTFCGSPPYTAPEFLLGKAYDGMKADVWSLGVVLYVLLTGGFPFPGEVTKLKSAIFAEQLKIPYWVSFACADLIHKMLAFHPAKRINITNVIQHRWLPENGISVTKKPIFENAYTKLHLEETPNHLNSTVVLFMQQHTEWTGDQIAEEVMKKNFYSPIYGTYQLLCSEVRESCIPDNSIPQPRRGSRGSITSGKANIEVEAPLISTQQFTRHTLSTVGDSELDKSETDETTTCNWTRCHNTNLGLVLNGEYNAVSTFNRGEGRRCSLCAENLLPLESYLFAKQIPSSTLVALAAAVYATNVFMNQFAHSALPSVNINNGSLSTISRILPLLPLERRASTDEDGLRSGYAHRGSSYEINILKTSRLKSISNSYQLRMKKAKGMLGSFSYSSYCNIGFVGSLYTKFNNNTECRRSWTPTPRNSPFISHRIQLEQVCKQTVTVGNEQVGDLQQLWKEFQKLKASTEHQSPKLERNNQLQNTTKAIKCAPQVSLMDGNNCCLKFPISLVNIFCSGGKQLEARSMLRSKRHLCDVAVFSSNSNHAAISVILPYNTDETLRRLQIAVGKFNLGFEQSQCKLLSSSRNETHEICISSNGIFLMQVNIAVMPPFYHMKSKIEFVYAKDDKEKCEQFCSTIFQGLQKKS